MAIRKRKKRRKTVVYKTLHRKLKIVQIDSVRTAIHVSPIYANITGT
jgi:hypothetical protein